MSYMWITTLFLYCYVFVTSVTSSNSLQDCESLDFDHKPGFWIRKLNITDGKSKETARFLIGEVYFSKITLDIETGDLAKIFGVKKAHVLTHLYSLYMTDQLLPFRVTNYVVMINFYHGDLAIIHKLDRTTGLYSAVKLGGNSMRYFLVIPSGVYFAIDVAKHTKDKYILTGLSLYNGNTERTKLRFGEWETLLQEFPQHSQVINALYRRAPDFPKPE